MYSKSNTVLQLPDGRKLTVKKGNIALEEVDVIVNSANGGLVHSRGVAGSLNKASRGELQRHSLRYIEDHGGIPVGEACLTKGGGLLKCKYVVHAVGPKAATHYPDPEASERISSAVRRSLEEAQEKGTTSIAFPPISARIFGDRIEAPAQTLLDAILKYKYPENKSILRDIRIVNIDQPTHACFANLLAQKRAEMEKEKKAVDQEASSATTTTTTTTTTVVPSSSATTPSTVVPSTSASTQTTAVPSSVSPAQSITPEVPPTTASTAPTPPIVAPSTSASTQTIAVPSSGSPAQSITPKVPLTTASTAPTPPIVAPSSGGLAPGTFTSPTPSTSAAAITSAPILPGDTSYSPSTSKLRNLQIPSKYQQPLPSHMVPSRVIAPLAAPETYGMCFNIV